jgi:hypothetical protein
MRVTIFALIALLYCGCKPGSVGQVPKKDGKPENTEAEPAQDSQGIPLDKGAMPPPPDPEEESKAAEPGIIGGAYLYCDAGEAKGKNPGETQVGCRTATVDDSAWFAADKSFQFYDYASNSMLVRDMLFPAPGDAYQMYFAENIAQMESRDVQLNITLPQGKLQMTSSVSPYHSELLTLRKNPGLTLMSTTDGVTVTKDRKSWSEWMPLKIPAAIIKLPPSAGRPKPPRGADLVASAELRFDDTVCTYQQGKGPKEEMILSFVSCSRDMWKPDQWVRVKALSLGIVMKPNATEVGDYAVTLQTIP